jgi:transposase
VLSRQTRITILELASRGVAKRAIARCLGLSRRAVRAVLASGQLEPPAIARRQKAEAHRDDVLALYASCQGNLVRVHEELLAQGAEISYPALTAFCRRQGIGQQPKQAAGRYEFAPGQETQHDTSLHRAQIGGQPQKVHSAAATLAYSSMLFFQGYPRFRRLECKSFLTETGRYFDGFSAEVLVDNTHLVVLHGSGAAMVPVPEMAAFAQRLGFLFRAHEIGDANRSARVERPFDFIEHNFFAGRTFADFEDLNHQARQWCDRVNQRYLRSRRARPIELFATERTLLRPLPLWLPDPYELARRTVDVEGYVCYETNRYSVPEAWIGDPIELRATLKRLTLEHRRYGIVEHARHLLPEGRRFTLAEHRRPRRKRLAPTHRELEAIAARAPQLLAYAQQLATRGKGLPTLALRQLLRMIRDYPQKPLHEAVLSAQHYGLFDLHRLETMVLKNIATDFFRFDGDLP